MKKIFSTLVVAIALLMAMPANAQLSWGVRAGLNLTDVSFNQNIVSDAFDNRTGFYVGPTAKFTLPVVGLALDASAIYDQKSAKAADGESYNAQAIAIPINARYGVGLGSVAEVFAFAGPQFAFNIASNKKYAGMGDWTWKSSNISINLGVGATVLRHLEAKINYNIACGTTGEFGVGSVAKGVFKGKYNSWQMGLAYYF